ncbi:hypothetical protein T484DRAFT_2872066 [Baffinella frigidus]|nr:hypothetical protein T484DRAFT_2872066 [Cryptophyta sp. CCMP2293]
MDNSQGCLFWWTPGSGKSIMVALLLELLLPTDFDVYVISTPQNINDNGSVGFKKCISNLLKFSPTRAHSPVTDDDERDLRSSFRSRKRKDGECNRINGTNFLSFRKFANLCDRQPDKVFGGGKKIALIIDESHEIFNDKKCPPHFLTATLSAFSNNPSHKIFALSGTPGKDTREMLLQLELVRGVAGRQDPEAMLDQRAGGWAERLRDYSQGFVSYVDGCRDLRNFPEDLGCYPVDCVMSRKEWAIFSDRQGDSIRALGGESGGDSETAIAEFFAKLGRSDGVDAAAYRRAVNVARTLQTATSAFWGGPSSGLCALLHNEESVTLDEVKELSAKFEKVAYNLLHPAKALQHLRTREYLPEKLKVMDLTDLTPLDTRHFVYSANRAGCTRLITCLNSLKTESGKEFKQFTVLDLVDPDRPDEYALRNAGDLKLDFEGQMAFLMLEGNAKEKEVLLKAFGYVTADSTRHEGFKRRDGKPFFQVLLGTHETNQGLTFLRVQLVHLLDPIARGWSQVVQATGRAVRRGTHSGLEGRGEALRCVVTLIYRSAADLQDLKTLQVAQEAHFRTDFIDSCCEFVQCEASEERARNRFKQLTDCYQKLRSALSSGKDTTQMAKEVKSAKKLLKQTQVAKEKEDEGMKQLAAWIESVTSGWVHVDPALLGKGKKHRFLQVWDVMPDEAVYDATKALEKTKEDFDRILKETSVDSSLLADFHAEPSWNTPRLGTHLPAKGVLMAGGGAGGAGNLSLEELMRRAAEVRIDAPKKKEGLRKEKRGNAVPGWVAEALVDVRKQFEAVQKVEVPRNWTNKGPNSVASLEVEEDHGLRCMVQAFMRQTQGCEKSQHCTHGRKMHHCKVVKIERVENYHLYKLYEMKKAQIKACLGPKTRASLSGSTNQHQGLGASLDPSINEFRLFHGTERSIARSIIAAHGFDERCASLGGLYGAGTYFADCACKSQQYAVPHQDETFTMLISRVTMGGAYPTTRQHVDQRRPPDNPDTPGRPFDSIFALSGRANGGKQQHNEYVVFASAQAYPEYLITYTLG